MFKYKGYPLLRRGAEILYGNIEDDYIILLLLQSVKKIGDLDVASKVSVALLPTSAVTKEGIAVEKCERTHKSDGLYEALDTGYKWLAKAN